MGLLGPTRYCNQTSPTNGPMSPLTLTRWRTTRARKVGFLLERQEEPHSERGESQAASTRGSRGGKRSQTEGQEWPFLAKAKPTSTQQGKECWETPSQAEVFEKD